MARRSVTAVLMSGGLDSALLLGRVLARGERAVPLYVRCGLYWEKVELYWLRRFLREARSPRVASLRVTGLPLRAVATTLLIELLLAIPIIFYLGIRQSHRIIGPMARLKDTFKAIGEGRKTRV